MYQNKKQIVFFILTGFFITNAITAELIGGKLIQTGPFVLSIGILPWPVVFLTTDLINEYFGLNIVRKLSLITAGLIAYTFLLLTLALYIPAAKNISPVNDNAFTTVFGQSLWIIIGSIIAFLCSQLIDALIFDYVNKKTQGKKIWLRATGSTLISQFIDSYIVLGIAFWLPGKINFETYITSATAGYTFKIIIALALTPFIYICHNTINAYIKTNQSH